MGVGPFVKLFHLSPHFFEMMASLQTLQDNFALGQVQLGL